MIPLANFSAYPLLFYIVPPFSSTSSSINPTITLTAQTGKQQAPVLNSSTNFQTQNSNLTQKETIVSEKNKQIGEGKVEEKKAQIQVPKVKKKEDIKKVKSKCAQKDSKNRPLTYQTERTYYMKQKIKGRSCGDKRILRKRGRIDVDKRKKNQQKKEQKQIGKKGKEKKQLKKNSYKKTKKILKQKEKGPESGEIEYGRVTEMQIGRIRLKEYLKSVRINLLRRQFWSR